MIKDTKAADRYARSFFLMMEEGDRIVRAHDELLRVLEFVKTHPEFSRLLLTTTISYDDKVALIDNLLDFVSRRTANFIKLLVDKNRFNLFDRIVECFHALFNVDRGIEEATVIAAFPVSEGLLENLRRVLEGKLKKKIILSVKTDPGLLGGLALYIRNEVIDGSLKERLMRMRKALFTTSLQELGGNDASA